MTHALRFVDDDGTEVAFDATDADALGTILGDLEAATVSACPDCRARVLAAVALVDLVDGAAPHPKVNELRDLADDAPTLHVFLVAPDPPCRHRRWRDPLADEWRDVVRSGQPHVRR